MIEIIGGVMMMGGGGMMIAASVPLSRSRSVVAAELVAALPDTPLPPPDAELDALIASID